MAKTALKVWLLTPVDHREPPFHFANVPHRIVVAAPSANDARRVAAGEFPTAAAALLDKQMADCVELEPTEMGVIAAQ